MKRYGNLFEKVASFDALLAASRRARSCKRFRTSTAQFEYSLENELIALEEELQSQNYQQGPCREFFIYESKPRKISAAPYRDRVVQHALNAVIEPIFERSYIHDSYACRMGKGTHKAVDRFTYYARRFKYVLKCDIEKYFASIDHEILKSKIRRKIKCVKTLWLIDHIIDASREQNGPTRYYPEDSLFTPHQRRRGIPIGNLTSQTFASLFLNDIDHFVKEQMPQFGYIRYMDDMALFANSKDELWKALGRMQELLGENRLTLKPNKNMVYPVAGGVDYLGYKVYPDHRRIRYENVVRYRRRLKRLQGKYQRREIELDAVRASVHSWIGHVQHADSWRLRESLFASAEFHRGGALRESRGARRVVEQQQRQSACVQPEQQHAN